MRLASPITYVVTLAVLVLTGCGREGDDTSPTPPIDPSTNAAPPDNEILPTPVGGDQAAPVAAYTAWLDALADRDPSAACARHAPELTIDLRFTAILLDRARLGDPCVDFVAVLWEQPDREYDPLGVEVTQMTAEDAFLAVDFAGEDQTVRMVRQHTRWLVETSEPRTSTAAADPRRWLAAWCDLELAMTPSELAALMGEPSGTYTIGNGGEPQLYWTQDQYDFRAYLDTDPPDGRTIDLVGDYDRLSDAERSALTCPELR